MADRSALEGDGMKYHAHFSKSVDDPGAFVEIERPTLEAAKQCCEDRIDEDAFGMPRVYVSEIINHPEDDIHLAAKETVEIEFHELDDGEWVTHPLDWS